MIINIKCAYLVESSPLIREVNNYDLLSRIFDHHDYSSLDISDPDHSDFADLAIKANSK